MLPTSFKPGVILIVNSINYTLQSQGWVVGDFGIMHRSTDSEWIIVIRERDGYVGTYHYEFLIYIMKVSLITL